MMSVFYLNGENAPGLAKIFQKLGVMPQDRDDPIGCSRFAAK